MRNDEKRRVVKGRWAEAGRHVARRIRRAAAALTETVWAPVLGKLAASLVVLTALAYVGSGALWRLLEQPPSPEVGAHLGAAALDVVDADPEPPPEHLVATSPDAADTVTLATSAKPPCGGGHGGILPDGRVVLNRASVSELQTLPGVGEKRAEAIVALRDRMGRFRRLEDLLRIRGLGHRSLKKLAPKIVLDPPAPTPDS